MNVSVQSAKGRRGSNAVFFGIPWTRYDKITYSQSWPSLNEAGDWVWSSSIEFRHSTACQPASCDSLHLIHVTCSFLSVPFPAKRCQKVATFSFQVTARLPELGVLRWMLDQSRNRGQVDRTIRQSSADSMITQSRLNNCMFICCSIQARNLVQSGINRLLQ